MVAGGTWPSLRAAQPRRLPQSTPKGVFFLSFSASAHGTLLGLLRQITWWLGGTTGSRWIMHEHLASFHLHFCAPPSRLQPLHSAQLRHASPPPPPPPPPRGPQRRRPPPSPPGALTFHFPCSPILSSTGLHSPRPHPPHPCCPAPAVPPSQGYASVLLVLPSFRVLLSPLEHDWACPKSLAAFGALLPRPPRVLIIAHNCLFTASSRHPCLARTPPREGAAHGGAPPPSPCHFPSLLRSPTPPTHLLAARFMHHPTPDSLWFRFSSANVGP